MAEGSAAPQRRCWSKSWTPTSRNCWAAVLVWFSPSRIITEPPLSFLPCLLKLILLVYIIPQTLRYCTVSPSPGAQLMEHLQSYSLFCCLVCQMTSTSCLCRINWRRNFSEEYKHHKEAARKIQSALSNIVHSAEEYEKITWQSFFWCTCPIEMMWYHFFIVKKKTRSSVIMCQLTSVSEDILCFKQKHLWRRSTKKLGGWDRGTACHGWSNMGEECEHVNAYKAPLCSYRLSLFLSTAVCPLTVLESSSPYALGS